MNRLILAFCVLSVLATAPVLAQANNPIGLELLPPGGRPIGRACGPFTCIPLPASVQAGLRHGLVAYGYPSSLPNRPRLLVVAISTPRPQCLAVPGLLQSLVLSPTLFLYAGGFASGPGTFCAGAHAQGSLALFLELPAGLPTGLSFLLQAVGETCDPSASCQLGFSSAIQVTIR